MFEHRNDENDTQRPAYATDTSIIKAAPGEGCPRCGGAVFAAEQMLARGSVIEIYLRTTTLFLYHTWSK